MNFYINHSGKAFWNSPALSAALWEQCRGLHGTLKEKAFKIIGTQWRSLHKQPVWRAVATNGSTNHHKSINDSDHVFPKEGSHQGRNIRLTILQLLWNSGATTRQKWAARRVCLLVDCLTCQQYDVCVCVSRFLLKFGAEPFATKQEQRWAHSSMRE